MLPTSSTGRAAALAAAARPKSHAGQPVPVRQRLVASLPSREMSRFLAACVAWYMASALSSNTSKALLSAPRRKSEAAALPPLSAPFPYPVSLTLIQFLFVHIFCAMAASRTLTSFVGLRTPLAKLQQPSWNRIREMGTLSIFNAVGHALSSLAISRVPVSTVHTIKALTPLFTVLSFRLLFAVVYPFRTYASLCPLTLGVMMACTGMAFNADDLLGLMAALASTLVFVANNILSKKVLTKGGHGPGEGEKTDKYSVLYYSSGISCVIMLPMVMYADLPSMLAAAVTPDDPLQKERLHDHLLETSTGVRGMQVTALGVMWGLTAFSAWSRQ
ncbi:related to sly41-transporter of the triose phosphate translocator family [Ceraceosorus bombacis]|uniref:Related to sly41-transporter of the triose phosphate translocator family n=1 Tax=Ceraceosorus bombacis TaxID=401625 RepID=A0A0P1B7J7_9BASI|nr:related to sly41-transporter of the triose phosphate translocator family [Ceraceosorus bombacis]